MIPIFPYFFTKHLNNFKLFTINPFCELFVFRKRNKFVNLTTTVTITPSPSLMCIDFVLIVQASWCTLHTHTQFTYISSIYANTRRRQNRHSYVYIYISASALFCCLSVVSSAVKPKKEIKLIKIRATSKYLQQCFLSVLSIIIN